MSTADQLLAQMLCWIEQREGCARQLQKLAGELEHLRKNSNSWQAVGSSMAVAGSASLIGAGIATVATGGAAAPLLAVAGGVSTGLGVGISLITKLTEHLVESDTMKEAKRIESKGLEIKQNIQKLFSRLRAEGSQAASSDDPDDLDRHIMSEISGAMARRNGLKHHFTKEMFQNPYFSSGATSDKSLGDDFFKTNLTVPLAGFLSFFTLKASGSELQSLFAKGGQQLIKAISTTGMKTVLKGGTMAIGGVIGLAFELPEAIKHWRDLIEKNNATEVSRSLRDTANALLQINNALKKQLDKIKEMLRDFDKLKSCIENSDRSAQQKAEFIEVVRRYCQDQNILNWLSQNVDTDIFFKLVDIFHFLKKEMDDNKGHTNQMDIDIIFVAHGTIEEPLIPASDLLPLFTIEDVILYSPWNCTVDAKVVYGIATGRLQTEHRVFHCTPRCGCQNNVRHQPSSLPPDWNSMRNAGGSQIANILVSPVTHPEDPAWQELLFLRDRFGGPGINRVVIPYVIPGYYGRSMTIPFYLVTLALSLVLFVFPFRARVHLGACLERASHTTLDNHSEYLAQQYATTSDFTMMTSSDTVFNQYPWLFNALRAEFH